MTNAEMDAPLEAGEASWERGEPMPAYPGDHFPITSGDLFWVGYVHARARDFYAVAKWRFTLIASSRGRENHEH